MAVLLTCNKISKHFGDRELFRELSISFADDEHIGLLGPNGAGKTTLLKALADLVQVDDGEINRRRSARIGFLPQEDRFAPDATVWSVLFGALADDALEEHDRETQVNIAISRFGLGDAHRAVSGLSGGWRKRLALAREIVRRPDLLLMDEPTNHLDMEGIQWLEEFLAGVSFSFLVVSHDRYFLERVTNRVVELNPLYPEGYFSVSGAYSQFLEKRADYLESLRAQESTLANIVRREDAFLRSNSKAQRTKSKSRIEEAYRLKDELRELKNRNAQTVTAGIDFENTGRKSQKLVVADGLAKTLGGRLLFTDVSFLLSPGTRLGLLGCNGSGKTTLIRMIAGTLTPDVGTIERADGLRVVVFDQMREALPKELPLRQALAAGKDDTVDFRGRSTHISSWAKRFLFRVDQLNMPVGELSGGEQARVLIARLMLQPADVLILDEPTNDLDIASLDVLEESLLEFPGAVVLVTHDRFMLDRVCTEILGLDGAGGVGRYGDCAQWLAAQSAKSEDKKLDAKNTSKKAKAACSRPRLTASERKELDDMESTIHEADEVIRQCELAMEDPAVASDHLEAEKRWQALESAKKHAQALYARWEELEAKVSEQR